MSDEGGARVRAMDDHCIAARARVRATLTLTAIRAYATFIDGLAVAGFEQVARGELTHETMTAGLRAAADEAKQMLDLWNVGDPGPAAALRIDDLIAKLEGERA